MKTGVVSESTGSSDICQPVADLASLQAKHYLEEGEAVLFALSSAKEEYAFTNTGLVTVCGSSAMSTKRTVERYEYMAERVTQLQFESCGVADRDCELKFHMGSRAFSIDIAKAELARAQHLYRVLLARTALDASVRSTTTTDAASKLFVEQAAGVYAWLQETFAQTNPRCYQAVLQAALERMVQADLKAASNSALPLKHAGERRDGRKEDHSATVQRHLSQRLVGAAQLRARSEAAVIRARRQRQRLVAICATSPTERTLRSAREHRTKQALVTATPQQAIKLRVLLEMIVRFQMHLLQHQKARMEPRGFARVWRRLDNVIAKARSKRNPEKRIQYVQRKLARAIAITSKVPKQTIDEEAENCSEAKDEPAALPVETVLPAAAARSEPPVVEFPPHQWIPPILLRMFEQVERGGRGFEASEALRISTRDLMLNMRTVNPFSHLQVLYREPPPGAADVTWEMRQSMTVQRITAALTASLVSLHDQAFPLFCSLSLRIKPVACWHRFSDVIESIRRLSVHFHAVVLYLYSVAMGREDASVTEGSIARQVTSQCQLDELRKAYDLDPQLGKSSDRLVRQSYAHFPELLAFLHQWRREPTVHVYGFSSSDAANEYIVNFNQPERYNQRTLAELSTHLRELHRLWRKSRLGTKDFKAMPIQSIGRLETEMKERFRAAIDLLYHHNSAHWIRNRQSLGYRIEKLHIKASKGSAADEMTCREGSRDPSVDPMKDKSMSISFKHEIKDEVMQSRDKAASSYHEHDVKPPKEKRKQLKQNAIASLTLKEEEKSQADTKCDDFAKATKPRRETAPKHAGQFRAPGAFSFSKQQSSPPLSLRSRPPKVWPDVARTLNGVAREEEALNNYKADCGRSRTACVTGQVHLNDIFAWTDEEIDTYEQEKEHVYELQHQLLALRENLALEASVDDAKCTWRARKLPSRLKYTMSLLEGWAGIRGVAERAVRHAEEIALHGAAEALIQRPSLRVNSNESSTDDASAAARTMAPSSLTGDGTTSLDAAAIMQMDVRELRATIGASRTSIGEMLKGHDGENSSEWRNHLLFFADASKHLLQIAQQQLPPEAAADTDPGTRNGDRVPNKERKDAGARRVK